MATMKAVRYHGPKAPFSLDEVAIPEPAAGAVRVRIAACGMCHTELHLRDGLLDLGRRDFAVGHEISGYIDAVGDGVEAERIGEKVIVYYYEGCGECAYCRRGDEQLCPAPLRQPGFISDGGYAEYVTVRARNCVTVPDHVDLAEIAPMGCAGTTAVHATGLARLKAGEWAVIQGVGGVGFALLQVARAAGARVIAIGLGAARLALAQELGAEAVIDAGTVPDVAAKVREIIGDGADVVFELVGIDKTMRASTAMLRPRGRLVLIGYTGDSYSVHPVELIVRELEVIGSVGATLDDLKTIVDLVAAGKVRSVIDRRLKLEDYETGLAALEKSAVLGRIVLTPGA